MVEFNKFYLIAGPFKDEYSLYPIPADGLVHYHKDRKELRGFLRKKFIPFSLIEDRSDSSWSYRAMFEPWAWKTWTLEGGIHDVL